MTTDNVQELLETPELAGAIEAVKQAGEAIRNMGGANVPRRRKHDRTLVSDADMTADRIVREVLARQFERDALLSEERPAPPALGGRLWVLDPIDGTKAFLRHEPGYAVQLALLEDGEPRVGVVYDPVAQRLFFAVRGKGAWVWHRDDELPVRASMPAWPVDSPPVLVTSASMPEEERASLLRQSGFKPGPVINSVGIKIGLLLLGAAHVYFSGHPLSWWDTAAPILIAREAGADACLLDGSQIGWDVTAPPAQLRHPLPVVVAPAGHALDVVARIASA